MIKEDYDRDFLNGNTMIGMRDDYSYGYCKKCGNIFEYHWNGCNPFSENKTCPKCGSFDEVETENHILLHIEMLKGFLHFTEIIDDDDDKRENVRRNINELHKIRRAFDKYKEGNK